LDFFNCDYRNVSKYFPELHSWTEIPDRVNWKWMTKPQRRVIHIFERERKICSLFYEKISSQRSDQILLLHKSFRFVCAYRYSSAAISAHLAWINNAFQEFFCCSYLILDYWWFLNPFVRWKQENFLCAEYYLLKV